MSRRAAFPGDWRALLAVAGALLAMAGAADAAEDAPIDKACVSFRIGTPQWMPEARYSALLDVMGRHPGVTD